MSKSTVDKYEQVLATDPSSTVFVELARAYLELGDNEKAIAVCQQGINHHPESVVGRVLWGKALINVGRAAEAMRQFDSATNIDRENPYAYNLIGEALLRKGLYRSALPILKKAVALQPDDGRIVTWLEQAKVALAGGPPPVIGDTPLPAPSPPAPPPTPLPVVAPVAEMRPPPPPPPSAPVWGEGGTFPAPPPPAVPAAMPPVPPVQPWPAQSGPARELSGFPFGPPPSPAPRRRQVASDVFTVYLPGDVDPQEEQTQLLAAYQPGVGVGAAFGGNERSLPPVPASELPLGGALAAEPQFIVREVTSQSEGQLPVVMGRTPTGELPPPPDPIDPFPEPGGVGEVMGGLTVDFERLSKGSSAELSEVLGGLTMDFDRLKQGASAALPGVLAGLPAAAAVAAEPPGPAGLLDDVLSAEAVIPASVSLPVREPLSAPATATPSASARSNQLLADIPDASVESPAFEAQAPEFNTQAAQAIAQEYEKELKAKLEVAKKKKSFLQRHGVKLAVSLGLLVVAGALGGSFWLTRQKNQGETLDSALAKGLGAIAADTKEQYLVAVKAFEQAESMDAENGSALAGAAYAHAMLYAEHGKEPAERAAALTALTPKVKSAFPDSALVVEYLTAADGAQAEAEKALLDSELDKSLVHAHAGRVLLSAKRYDDALARLKKAAELDSHQTLALVALGDYYLAFEDWDSALDMMARAEPLSKHNPQRVLGHSEARLELGKELADALAALEGLSGKASLTERQRGRYSLLLGRALSANGRHEEAKKALSDGLAAWGKPMAFPFALALGQAYRSAGQMERAQKYFEDARKLKAKSEEAAEGLGRVLLAQGREKELLEKLKVEKDLGRVALVRGIAWFKLGEPNRAREELARTQVGGKYPSEAALYLSLADAADQGTSDRAVEILEKAAQGKARQRSVAMVALARVYLERKQPDRARAQLEEAAKDPLDYEASTMLGQLLLDAEAPAELALEPLQRAFEHNASHAPARHLLVRALLALGRTPEAVAHAEGWTQESPGLEAAWRDAARAYLEAGRISDATASAARVSAASEDLDAWRVKARVSFAAGDTPGGMAALQRANGLDPHDAATFCEIGHALVRQGDSESALKAYAKVLEENPKAVCGKSGPLHARPTSRGRPAPKELLGGFIGRAKVAWEKAFLQATLARVLLDERDAKAALASAEAAVATAPGHPAAWFALGEVLRRQRNDEKAREAYAKVTKLDASWASPHLALADLLVKQGGDALPEALREYELVQRIDQNEQDVVRATKAITGLKRSLQK